MTSALMASRYQSQTMQASLTCLTNPQKTKKEFIFNSKIVSKSNLKLCDISKFCSKNLSTNVTHLLRESTEKFPVFHKQTNRIEAVNSDASKFLRKNKKKELDTRRQNKPIFEDRLANLLAPKRIVKAENSKGGQNWGKGSSTITLTEGIEREGNTKEDYLVRSQQMWEEGLKVVGGGGGRGGEEFEKLGKMDGQCEKQDSFLEKETKDANLEKIRKDLNLEKENVLKILAAESAVEKPENFYELACEAVEIVEGIGEKESEKIGKNEKVEKIEDESEKLAEKVRDSETTEIEEIEEDLAVKLASESAVEEPNEVKKMVEEEAENVSELGGGSVEKVEGELEDKAGLSERGGEEIGEVKNLNPESEIEEIEEDLAVELASESAVEEPIKVKKMVEEEAENVNELTGESVEKAKEDLQIKAGLSERGGEEIGAVKGLKSESEIEEIEEDLAVKLASESAVEEPNEVKTMVEEESENVSALGGGLIEKVEEDLKKKAGLSEREGGESEPLSPVSKDFKTDLEIEEVEEDLAVKIASESAVEEPNEVKNMVEEAAENVTELGGGSFEKIESELEEKAGLSDKMGSEKDEEEILHREQTNAEISKEKGSAKTGEKVGDVSKTFGQVIENLADHMDYLAASLEEEAKKFENEKEKMDLEKIAAENNAAASAVENFKEVHKLAVKKAGEISNRKG